MQVIIFPTDNNRVAILAPAPDLDLTEVAEKDVPEGKPWRIVDTDDLPPSNEWLWSDTGPIIAAPAPAPDPKWSGIEFEGVMCSATADDQAGLAAVLLAIQLQGAAFQPTRFYFANGNTLVLSLANYQAFTAVWLPFRQSFFAV